jgi:hypothetical protein
MLTALSALPETLDPPAKRRCHLPHTDLPRLFPLSHQGFKGLYSLAYAAPDRRLPSRYVHDLSDTFTLKLISSYSAATCSTRNGGEGGKEDS